ncbi:MAG TPA: sulfatase-like hydrolase/transferase [Isosphaeraceae bacterium]|nr:sulfatase-like hydrolase/transferase [Isosphaeraceae bacterium]
MRRCCRQSLAAILAVALVELVLPARLPAGAEPESAARRPNLLLIIADDQGGNYLGVAGDPHEATPNLDALARQGVWFERAYCNAPLCTPSRQSLITGKLPHAIGVTQLTTRLADDVLTLGEWFRDHDYQTAAIGKMHFNGPSAHGFRERIDLAEWESHLRDHPPRGGDHRRPWRPFLDPAAVWLNAACQSAGLPTEAMDATYFTERALDYLKRRGDRPFALVVSYYEPHSPFRFPRRWRPRFRPEQFSVPAVSKQDRQEQPAVFANLSPDEIRGIQAAYYTSLSYVDSQIGRLIHGLDELGLSSRTLVVYVGDNGYMLGQHGRFEKHCFYEPAVRIPLIMRWADHLPRGRRITDLVEMIDVLPTVLHLLQLPMPPRLQGIDLEPLIQGRLGARGHDVVFSEYLENEEAMVRSDRFKLIVGTGRRLRQDGYHTGKPLPGPYQRLFDIVKDPGEARDLSADPAHQAIKEDLLHRMYLRFVTTREGLDPIPSVLTELGAIHWCLVPRDRHKVERDKAASGAP